MTRLGWLTEEVVAFLMCALMDERVARTSACKLVAPWVEGDAPSTPLCLLAGF